MAVPVIYAHVAKTVSSSAEAAYRAKKLYRHAVKVIPWLQDTYGMVCKMRGVIWCSECFKPTMSEKGTKSYSMEWAFPVESHFLSKDKRGTMYDSN